MPSDYPDNIDTWASFGAQLDDAPLHEDVHADLQDAITAMQQEMGTNPSGSAADVAARFTSLRVNSGLIVVFTSSGLFEIGDYDWAKYVIVHCIGGGGGSGGCGLTDGTKRAESGGGGGGGYSRKRLAASALAASVAVTVGAGGAAGNGFVTVPSATDSGQQGGTSSFGGHCSATGGTGGGAMVGTSASSFAARGGGGMGSGGDINLPGDDGGGGVLIDTHVSLIPLSQNYGGAAGGPFSAKRVNGPSLSTFGGVVGKSFGGGASGARANVNETPNGPAGSDGAAGAVIVEVY